MAQQHPFITREEYKGSFEPTREVEIASESGGENSDLSMDSLKKNDKGSNEANKIYHGSCPSLMMMHSDGHLGGHFRGGGVPMSQPRP